jgi:hypothetical protein
VVVHELQNLGDRTATGFLYPASYKLCKRACRQTVYGEWDEGVDGWVDGIDVKPESTSEVFDCVVEAGLTLS